MLPLSPRDYLKEAFITNMDTRERRRMSGTTAAKEQLPKNKEALSEYWKKMEKCPKLEKGNDGKDQQLQQDKVNDNGSSLYLSLGSAPDF